MTNILSNIRVTNAANFVEYLPERYTYNYDLYESFNYGISNYKKEPIISIIKLFNIKGILFNGHMILKNILITCKIKSKHDSDIYWDF